MKATQELDCSVSCTAYLPTYEQEAPVVYTLYAYTGTAAFAASLGIFLVQIIKKGPSLYPNGILTQLMAIFIALSSIYMINSFNFLFSENIKISGVHCYSFGLTFSCCPVESSLYVYFSLCLIGWNFVWLLDLVKFSREAGYVMGSYMGVYCIGVYMLAAVLCSLFFGVRDNLFAMGRTYTCSITGRSYEYTLNSLNFAYLIWAGFVFYSYGREAAISLQRRRLQDRLRFAFSLKKIYVLIFAVFRVLDIVFIPLTSPWNRQTYALLKSLEPLFLSTPWLVLFIRNLCCGCYYPTPLPTFQDLLLPSLLTQSSTLILPPTPRFNKSQSLRENNDEASLLEFLVAGIKTAEEAAAEANVKLPAASQKESCAEILVRKICGCCIESPDEYESYEPAKSLQCSMIAGYPTLSQRKTLLDKAEILRESKVEVEVDVHLKRREGARLASAKVSTVAPRIFEGIRTIHNVCYEDFFRLFGKDFASNLRIFSSLQNGNVHLIQRTSGRFFVTVLSQGEYEFFRTVLPDYYMHYMMNQNSYILPMLGCYVAKQDAEQAFAAAQANFPEFSPHALLPFSSVQVAEITGNTHESNVPKPMPVFVAGISDKTIRQKALDSLGNLGLHPLQSEKILKQLHADTVFLGKHDCIGYSLQIVVTETPYESFVTTADPLRPVEGGHTILSGLHKLVLREEKGERQYLVFEEYGCGGGIEEISTVVNYSDIEKIIQILTMSPHFPQIVANRAKSMKFSRQDDDAKSPSTTLLATINFPLVMSTVSLESYGVAKRTFSAAVGQADLLRVGRSNVDEEEEARKPSVAFNLPDVNQVLKQAISEGVSDPDAVAKNATAKRRRSSYAPIRELGVADAGGALGMEELKEIAQNDVVPVIQQLVFDSIKGVYKRQIRFGITDYLIGNSGQDERRRVDRDTYCRNFIERVERIFLA